MYLDYTSEQQDLKAELRRYFATLISKELEDEIATLESGGPLYHRALQRMGRDGWLGIGWPREYGGQGRPAIEQFIFFDEVQRAGFPIPLLTLNTVGPTLMKYGSDAQRQRLLPRILEGTLHFSIGYTEPQAGTDLASLTTRAERDGDHYVVNGQKVFTSLADHADYIWLACRTDPNAPKHAGISILMVDTRLPGVSIQPIRTLGDNRTSTTFYENVRVPADMLVGPENAGWKLITNQLNHERVSLFTAGIVERFLEETLAWARSTRTAEGQRVIDLPWVQMNLARVHAGTDILRLMNWRQCWNIERGGLPPQEASTVKLFGSEFYVESSRLLMEILGEAGTLQRGSPGAALKGRLERYYRSTLVLTFGGGTNEIQRDIVAMAGLRMPKPPR
ncbi:MAG TPA: acyl-CoA dehydrogenase family protein [Polyangiaceae bacterium]|nr:acyl-CoA dehydrogenase family protein [Polyangiaceae bacterium]